MKVNDVQLYATINKVDAEQRMVWGYASTDAVDAHGEVVTKDAMKGAWDDYMEYGNLREMHQPSAVGVVKEHTFDDKGVFIGAKVVDDTAWKKVQEGVYKAFSIGGNRVPGGYDKATKTINQLQLVEISLVDRPANPEARIELFKLADNTQGDTTMPHAAKDAANKAAEDELLEVITKAEFTPAEMVDILKAAAAAKKAKDDKKAEDDATTDDADKKAADAKAAKAKADAEKTVVVDVKKNAKDNPSPLRKSLRATLAKAADDIQKGMYDVAQLAYLMEELQWVAKSAQWEAEYEGDGSTVPQELCDAIQALGKILLKMAAEEIAELDPNAPDAVVAITNYLTAAPSAPGVAKVMEVIAIVKEGKRNSGADHERIQKAHDLLNELGAECKAEELVTEKVVDAPAEDERIQKMLDAVTKSGEQVEKLSTQLGKAHDRIAALEKTLAKTPQPAKGVKTVVVSKGQEVADGGDPKEVTPVLKLDGTVDVAATEMKKVHAGGGMPLADFRMQAGF